MFRPDALAPAMQAVIRRIGVLDLGYENAVPATGGGGADFLGWLPASGPLVTEGRDGHRAKIPPETPIVRIALRRHRDGRVVWVTVTQHDMEEGLSLHDDDG